MKEIWKDIVGYEKIYKISNLGNVLSCSKSWKTINDKTVTRKPKLLKKRIDKDGYEYVHLWNNQKAKHYRVHQLVARAFMSNPEKKPQVNHKNGIRTDNHVENLEWATASENIKHAFKVLKRNPSCCKSVKCIETGIVYKSITSAAKEYNITPATICGALSHRKVKEYTITTAGGVYWERASTPIFQQ